MIHTLQEVAIRFLDLSGLPEAERQSVLDELIRTDARKPFDLAHGPLLRVSLFRLGAEEHVALLVLHHIISDGWSMGVILRELAALYANRAAGKLDGLQKLDLQYVDYAVWQRDLLEVEQEKQLRYWQNVFGGAD